MLNSNKTENTNSQSSTISLSEEFQTVGHTNTHRQKKEKKGGDAPKKDDPKILGTKEYLRKSH